MKTIVLIGQSNMASWATLPTTLTPDPKVKVWSGSAWVAPTGDPLIRFGNNLVSWTGDDIHLVMAAINGSALLQATGSAAGYWQNAIGPNSCLAAAFAQCSAAGITPDFFCLFQGEAESYLVDSDVYHDGLIEMYGVILSHFGKTPAQLPIIVGLTGNYIGQPGVSYVRQAQIDFALNHPGAKLGPCAHDLPLADGVVHMTAAGTTSLAARFAKCVLHEIGLEACSGAGPRILSAVRHGKTAYLAILKNADRQLFVPNPSLSLSGFEVSENGFANPALIGGQIRMIDAGTIIVPLAKAKPVSIRYMWGDNPDRSNIIGDNGNPFYTPTGPWDSLGLPLQPTAVPVVSD